MIKRLSLVIGSLCLIIGFQNCAQQGADGVSDISGGSSVVLSSTEASKISYVEVPAAVSSIQDLQKTSSASVASDARLLVSPKTGVIHIVDSLNNKLDEKCLSSDDLARLQELLANASVCQMPVAKADVCATKYTPAYASLVLGQSRVSLGEERDSCGYGRQEICGELGDVFKTFVSYVRSSYSQMECQ